MVYVDETKEGRDPQRHRFRLYRIFRYRGRVGTEMVVAPSGKDPSPKSGLTVLPSLSDSSRRPTCAEDFTHDVKGDSGYFRSTTLDRRVSSLVSPSSPPRTCRPSRGRGQRRFDVCPEESSDTRRPVSD